MAEKEYPCEEQMFRSSDDVRQSFITGIEAFAVKPVEYSVVNGRALFEGDIVLGTAEDMETIKAALDSDASDGGGADGPCLELARSAALSRAAMAAASGGMSTQGSGKRHGEAA